MTAHALNREASWALSGLACGSVRPADAADETDEGEDGGELEVPEAELDEADLPALDMDDPEAPLHEGMDHRDLLDGGWLERRDDDSADREEEGAAYIDVGLTIELNGPETGEELAQVVELDVGSLLTLLPGEPLDSDVDVSRELGHSDGSFALNALSDMLLPEHAAEHHERAEDEVGDDERFPAFEDSLIVTRQRPTPEEGEGVGEDDVI